MRGSSKRAATSSRSSTNPVAVPEPANVGVVDAGIVLTRLDRRRRSHAATVTLFESSLRGTASLHLSVVNLAEALQHAQAHADDTGVDVVAVLSGFGVAIAVPDVGTARSVAALSRRLVDVSLADRFALATAQALGARLHTTDRVLAGVARRCRVPTSLY
jgi:predicted nucleic acid-binding protein